MYTLSLRTTPPILTLYAKIAEYQPGVNRTDLTNQAISYALSAGVDWKSLAKMNIKSGEDDSEGPNLIQLKVDGEVWRTITEQIKNAFTPPLKKITIPYAVKLILIGYLRYLAGAGVPKEADSISVEVKSDIKEMNMDFPDMMSTLTKMLLSDPKCRELEQIANITKDWRQKHETTI